MSLLMGIMMLGVVMDVLQAVACAGVALALLPVALGAALTRMRQLPQPTTREIRSASALPMLDVSFMALSMAVMPSHAISEVPVRAHETGHAAVSLPAIELLPVLSWSVGLFAIGAHLVRRRDHTAVLHVACSGAMVGAMVLMMI